MKQFHSNTLYISLNVCGNSLLLSACRTSLLYTTVKLKLSHDQSCPRVRDNVCALSHMRILFSVFTIIIRTGGGCYLELFPKRILLVQSCACRIIIDCGHMQMISLLSCCISTKLKFYGYMYISGNTGIGEVNNPSGRSVLFMFFFLPCYVAIVSVLLFRSTVKFFYRSN